MNKMCKTVSYNNLEGLSVFESPDKVKRILDNTLKQSNIVSWDKFLKTLDSSLVFESLSQVDLGSIDFCGFKYREVLNRSSKIKSWIDSWSGENVLKNTGDVLELWRNVDGMSGVFISQEVMSDDKRQKKTSYWFYHFKSTGRIYQLRYVMISEKGEVFKPESKSLVFSAFVDISYDQLHRTLSEVYHLPHTGPGDKITRALLEMIVFKVFSKHKKEPRTLYHSESGLTVNYLTWAESIKVRRQRVEETVEV